MGARSGRHSAAVAARVEISRALRDAARVPVSARSGRHSAAVAARVEISRALRDVARARVSARSGHRSAAVAARVEISHALRGAARARVSARSGHRSAAVKAGTRGGARAPALKEVLAARGRAQKVRSAGHRQQGRKEAAAGCLA